MYHLNVSIPRAGKYDLQNNEEKWKNPSQKTWFGNVVLKRLVISQNMKLKRVWRDSTNYISTKQVVISTKQVVISTKQVVISTKQVVISS